MNRSKIRGTQFETATLHYLKDCFDDNEDRIHREVLHGSKDIGDISGIYSHGKKVVIECKNYSKANRMSEFLRQAEVERGNADALAGVVITKRPGVGMVNMSDQMVSMRMIDFVAILTGVRPDE